jgi:hypothetical protein
VTVTSYASASLSEQQARYGRVRVTVGDADVRDLVVPRVRPVAVRARFVIEDLRGSAGNGILQFSPADGNPMQGGATRILGPDDWLNAERTPLELPGLLPGRYVFTLMPAGGAPRLSLKSILANGLDVTRGAVEIDGPSDVDVVITLTGRVIRISGTVRDPSGGAAPEATVLAFPTDRMLWSNQGVSPTWIRAGRASDRGEFQVEGLRAGEYFLAAIDPSVVREWRDVDFLNRVSRQAARMTVEWGQNPRVDLRMVDVR